MKVSAKYKAALAAKRKRKELRTAYNVSLATIDVLNKCRCGNLVWTDAEESAMSALIERSKREAKEAKKEAGRRRS